jgi:hypothetical protein
LVFAPPPTIRLGSAVHSRVGTFPAGAYDDWVDAWSQGAKRLIYIKPKPTAR